MEENPDPQRTEKIVKSLVNKPTKKPDFSLKMNSKILQAAKEFIPIFKESTNKLLENEEERQKHVVEIDSNNMHTNGMNGNGQYIEMVC